MLNQFLAIYVYICEKIIYEIAVDFTFALNSTSSNSYAIRMGPRYVNNSYRVQMNF